MDNPLSTPTLTHLVQLHDPISINLFLLIERNKFDIFRGSRLVCNRTFDLVQIMSPDSDESVSSQHGPVPLSSLPDRLTSSSDIDSDVIYLEGR